MWKLNFCACAEMIYVSSHTRTQAWKYGKVSLFQIWRKSVKKCMVVNAPNLMKIGLKLTPLEKVKTFYTGSGSRTWTKIYFRFLQKKDSSGNRSFKTIPSNLRPADVICRLRYPSVYWIKDKKYIDIRSSRMRKDNCRFSLTNELRLEKK